MYRRVRASAGVRVRRLADRASVVSGSVARSEEILVELRRLHGRLDAIEVTMRELAGRAEITADNRALGLDALARELHTDAARAADAREQHVVAATERVFDGVVANVKGPIVEAAADLTAAAAGLSAEPSDQAGGADG